jgi:ribosomal protein S18 acetylase RimI-like enzyme
MLETHVFNATNKPTELEKGQIANFLHRHLEEYGDPKDDILNCLSYALKERVSFGGFVVVVKEKDSVVGAVIVNKTGMSGYIPENILVYIATHNEHRGKGLGKLLMEKTIKLASGDIALHVERDNPAIHLYEKYGFKTPYLEMRYKRP